MQLIKNKEELEAIRPYKNYEFVYPIKYPVLVCFESIDGGLMGDYWVMDIIDIPANIDQESFIKGVNAVAKNIVECKFIGKLKKI